MDPNLKLIVKGNPKEELQLLLRPQASEYLPQKL